jgi:hypothetical protein
MTSTGRIGCGLSTVQLAPRQKANVNITVLKSATIFFCLLIESDLSTVQSSAGS